MAVDKLGQTPQMQEVLAPQSGRADRLQKKYQILFRQKVKTTQI